jgi:phenylpropionate dioxygenase-like ring-hydroxylating dioxygenase large terminal subunit
MNPIDGTWKQSYRRDVATSLERPAAYPTVNELDAAGEERLYRAMAHFWHPVAYASEVTDGPVAATLLDERLVLVRLGGEVRCFRDLCVHRGTALSLGAVERDELRCAYHGWTYGPDGVCTKIPARFGSNIPSRAKLTRYACQERHGLVWVCLADEARFPIPEFPQYDDPPYRSVEVEMYDWRCSAHRRIENYVDFSHFAWVHDGILGDRNHPEVPDHDVWREDREIRFGEGFFHEPHRDPEADVVTRSRDREGLPDRTGTILADKSYRLSMPLTVLLDQRLPGDKHYILFFTASPTARQATRSFTLMSRNYEIEPSADGKFLSFNDLVVGQDRPIVESQRPEQLPFDLSAELHIRGVDKVSIEYRKWLVELTNELEPV